MRQEGHSPLHKSLELGLFKKRLFFTFINLAFTYKYYNSAVFLEKMLIFVSGFSSAEPWPRAVPVAILNKMFVRSVLASRPDDRRRQLVRIRYPHEFDEILARVHRTRNLPIPQARPNT